MLTDAHCHPFDLAQIFPQAEEERRRLGVLAAASATDFEEFEYCENLAKKAAAENAAPLLPCFAVHPQFPAESKEQEIKIDDLLDGLDKFASEGRLTAVGECGFDLFNAAYKETEAVQDTIFSVHLEIAVKYGLPIVLHVRRALHKIFPLSEQLSKCPSVIYHSWAGTFEEAEALLRRRVNAYFSFGNVVNLNHKQALRCCALLPTDRLLTETDSPFQPQRSHSYSQWADLPGIIKTISTLRKNAENVVSSEKQLEIQIESNFKNAYHCHKIHNIVR
jgi:TatD DNase family protein